MKAQLHTVVIECVHASQPTLIGWEEWTHFECDFSGIHFSRTDLDILKRWVRVAARNIYGPRTQVIFLLERTDQ